MLGADTGYAITILWTPGAKYPIKKLTATTIVVNLAAAERARVKTATANRNQGMAEPM
jgi:hypothetical protein